MATSIARKRLVGLDNFWHVWDSCKNEQHSGGAVY